MSHNTMMVDLGGAKSLLASDLVTKATHPESLTSGRSEELDRMMAEDPDLQQRQQIYRMLYAPRALGA